MNTNTTFSTKSKSFKLEIDPVIPVLKNIVKGVDVFKEVRSAIPYVSSSALQNVTLTTLSALPHIYMGGTVMDGINIRAHYLEAGLMSLASLVYNVAFTGVFTLLSAVTLFQVESLRYNMRKHAIHSLLATGATLTSATGVAVPYAALMLNAITWAGSCFLAVRGITENHSAMNRLQSAYKQNKNALETAALKMVNNDEEVYKTQVVPVLQAISNVLERQNPNITDLCKDVCMAILNQI